MPSNSACHLGPVVWPQISVMPFLVMTFTLKFTRVQLQLVAIWGERTQIVPFLRNTLNELEPGAEAPLLTPGCAEAHK